MKRLLLLGCTSLLVGGVWAQAGGASSTEAAAQLEHDRINRAREQVEREFEQANKGCYEQFVVNSCVNRAQDRRREALADLKRQELELNDRQRLHKGAARQQKIEDKNNPEAVLDRSAKLEQAGLTQSQARERANNRAAEREKQQQQELDDTKARQDRLAHRHAQQQERQEKSLAAAAERERYLAKQKEASERKVQHQKKLAERTKSGVAPLPATPASAAH